MWLSTHLYFLSPLQSLPFFNFLLCFLDFLVNFQQSPLEVRWVDPRLAPYLPPFVVVQLESAELAEHFAQNRPNTVLTSGLGGLLLRARLPDGPWLPIGPCEVGTAWTPGLQGPSTSLRFLFLEKCLEEQQLGAQEADIFNTRWSPHCRVLTISSSHICPAGTL